VIAGAGADAQGFSLAQLGHDIGRETLQRFRFCGCGHRRHSTE
jgi:hypothetical protein